MSLKLPGVVIIDMFLDLRNWEPMPHYGRVEVDIFDLPVKLNQRDLRSHLFPEMSGICMYRRKWLSPLVSFISHGEIPDDS